MKILTQPFLLAFILFLLGVSSHAQTPPPLSFYPYRAGNVWQYKDASNDQVFYTKFIDSDSLASDSSIYVRGHRLPEGTIFEKIDTAFNVFNLLFQPSYPRYKLNANVGQAWQVGLLGADTVRATVVNSFSDRVFGVLTIIKVYRFEVVRPPPQPPFWLGDDYLASGFGLVGSRQEPNLVLYLSGAIIGGVRWGTILSAAEGPPRPTTVTLRQNYPNPFNPATMIEYDLPTASHVRLKIFDALGRDISTLVNAEQEGGVHREEFMADHIASGVYFYRLEAGGRTLTKKMIVQK